MPIIEKGYNKTEIGTIPEDWTLKKLKDILLSTQLGGNYQNSEEETPYPLMKMGNIERGNINLDKIEYIKQNVKPSERDKLNFGDILFNTRNTLELVGKVAIWRDELPIAYFNSNLMRLKFNIDVSNFFMNYVFNSKSLLTQLKSIATGTTSVGAIYTRDLFGIQIPLPELEEQSAIAQVLSDADDLIESLDKLITKKKLIKQAAMQELLTSKKRLSGFSERWAIKKLGKIGYFKGGSGFPLKYQKSSEGTFPFYKVSDMNNKGNIIFMSTSNNYISEYVVKKIGATIFPKNSIIFAKIGAAIFLERKRILSTNSCIDNNMMGFIVDKHQANYRFIYYKLIQTNFGKLSSTTALPSLNGNELGELDTFLPTDLREQEEIARIISDMDGALEALERKRDKYKQLKVGLMQQLLTGRIRLKWKS
ncbi:MAG: restriction endonuclease subunit S [Candidatus Bathyarchaeia archaeon]